MFMKKNNNLFYVTFVEMQVYFMFKIFSNEYFSRDIISNWNKKQNKETAFIKLLDQLVHIE